MNLLLFLVAMMVLLKFGICGSFRGNGQERSFVVFVLFCCDNALRSSVFEKSRSAFYLAHRFFGGLPLCFYLWAKPKSERGREEEKNLPLVVSGHVTRNIGQRPKRGWLLADYTCGLTCPRVTLVTFAPAH